MDPTTRDLIAALHQAETRFVIAVTGGGAAAVGTLFSVPGASRSILEAIVPYHEQALVNFLGFRPEQFCSAETAAAMARRAAERASWLAPTDTVAGVACTASLASDRPKRGEHRFFVAVETAERRLSLALTLAKGARDRLGEEAVVDAVMLNAMADAAGISPRIEVPLLPGEQLDSADERKHDPLLALLRGELAAVAVSPDGRVGELPRPAALMPGAFNPLHAGHGQLAVAAARRLGLPVAFELSVVNVDKPPLAAAEIRRRLRAFAWCTPVWLTRAATFVEKARLFPGTVFVVGADTAERIVLPRYYGDSLQRLAETLAEIRTLGCRFFVGGRIDETGVYRCLERVQVPGEHRDLFVAIPETEFRCDVSSTALRDR
jgi:nicotinamide mononucleotide (NMN) deamidase PncC